MIKNLTEIKAKSDIVDIISHFVTLRKAGANYQAPCPFHSEKSASFIVSPQKQIFTCFGCGKSGDVFKFLSEFKSLSFTEAAQEVGEMCGVSIEYERGQGKQEDKKDIYQKYEELFKRARESLLQKSEVVKYLYNRGLTQDDFTHFDIGYCPSLDSIRAIFDTELGLKLGVLKKRQDGAIYTPFKERVLFAIRNGAHKIVGLSGRTHPYYNFRNAPKYLNSSESFLFKKSENCYLLSRAKSSIKDTHKAYIVEGYMDTIALHKLGYKNAIATCGTACNLTHINQLFRLDSSVEIVLAFDNDEAGKKASLRALDLLFSNKFYNAKVGIIEGDYKDVGEILEQRASQSTQEQKGAKDEPMSIFKEVLGLKFAIITKMRAAHNAKEKDEILKEYISLIDREENYYQKQTLIEHIAHITKIPQEFFYKKKSLELRLDNTRILRLLWQIYNNEDCAYLSNGKLDLASIPKDLRGDLESFLHTGKLSDKALQISLREELRSDLTINAFYKEILSLNIAQALKELERAKIARDTHNIISLTEYIQQNREELRAQDMF